MGISKYGVIAVCVIFLNITPRKSDWKYFMENMIMIDGWNGNGNQWNIYSEGSADVDHFEWSHVHTQQNTWRVMGILS